MNNDKSYALHALTAIQDYLSCVDVEIASVSCNMNREYIEVTAEGDEETKYELTGKISISINIEAQE